MKLLIERAVLVYQGGIANVFAVEGFSRNPVGRGKTKRLLQHVFSVCESYAQGLADAGAQVCSMGCNQTGDIINSNWTYELNELPFSDKFKPVTRERIKGRRGR